MNNDVRKQMEYLYKERKVQLCYTPVYMMDSLKCSFLNIRSLHKHFISVKAKDHNICASDIIFLAETRLISPDDNDSYQNTNFPNCMSKWPKNGNKDSRPPHGIICYAKNSIKILEVQRKSCELFGSHICLCATH